MQLAPKTKELIQENALKLGFTVVAFVVASIFSTKIAVFAMITLICYIVVATLLQIRKYNKLDQIPNNLRLDRDALLEAESSSRKNPILEKWFSMIRSEFIGKLKEISAGRISFESFGVHSVSVEAIDLVTEGCTLVYPINSNQRLLSLGVSSEGYSEAMDAHRTSQLYYKKMVDKNNQLKAQGEGKGITRLFIIEKHSDMLPETIKFIAKNYEDSIDIRFLVDDNADSKRPSGIESLDFGWYSGCGGSWIMALSAREVDGDGEGQSPSLRYTIETGVERTSKYKDFLDELMSKSMAYPEFRVHLHAPVNEHWSAYFQRNNSFDMKEPHGLSRSEADHIAGCVQACLQQIRRPTRQVSTRETSKILVLGRTPKLLTGLTKLPDAEVYSLDIISMEQEPFALYPRVPGVTYLEGNWLECDDGSDKDPLRTVLQKDKFQAIAFDEALNNLSRVQLNYFLPIMRRLLHDEGLVIGRMLGRFESPAGVMGQDRPKDVDGVIACLRKLLQEERAAQRGGLKHEDFASSILVYMLSGIIPDVIDPETHMVDCSIWNQCLDQLSENERITDEERSLWELPFEFRLLAPSEQLIRKEAEQAGFRYTSSNMRYGDYQHNTPDIARHYRIVEFAPKSKYNSINK